jgi:predicted Zn finger-like uncharacterized protein
MRIECPACAAAYEVPDHLLLAPDGAAARPVRCLRCNNRWQPVAPRPAQPPPFASGSDPVLPGPALLEPAPARGPATMRNTPPAVAAQASPLQPGRAPARVTQPGGMVAPLLAWALSLALLAGAAILLVRHRDAVVAAWPPAARLFLALGLPLAHNLPP